MRFFWAFVLLVAMVGCHRRPPEEDDSASCPQLQCPSPSPAGCRDTSYETQVYKTIAETRGIQLERCEEDRKQLLSNLEDSQNETESYKKSYYEERNRYPDCN